MADDHFPLEPPLARSRERGGGEGRTSSISRTIDKWIALVCVLLPLGATAQMPASADEAHQRRVARLAEQLRCLVCQNQSIADSNAELAVDLRRQIDEQIRQGRTVAEIVDFMVQRYGDFVLYKPPVKATTLVLWFGPVALLLLGSGILLHHLRERRKWAGATPLSVEDQRVAARLLGEARADERE